MSAQSSHDPPNQYKSLDIVYEVVKARLAEQNSQASTLDSKSNFNLAAATLLTAGAVALQGEVSSWGVVLVPFLTAISVITYVLLVVFSYQAYRLREYETISELRKFRNKYVAGDAETTKLRLVDTLIVIAERNDKILSERAKKAQRAVTCLMVEALIIAFLSIVQVVF